ncbi:MAG: ribosomal protein S8e-domain-containing protein, partial [Olpidium bornovanus]
RQQTSRPHGYVQHNSPPSARDARSPPIPSHPVPDPVPRGFGAAAALFASPLRLTGRPAQRGGCLFAAMAPRRWAVGAAFCSAQRRGRGEGFLPAPLLNAAGSRSAPGLAPASFLPCKHVLPSSRTPSTHPLPVGHLRRHCTLAGISRDSRHKRSATGAKRAQYRKKRKFELGRQPANTKLGAKRIHTVRVRGGNTKFRALRLDTGNFSWGSESVTRKTRLVDVVYNASNNELVRTKTLVKNAIVQVDATPFRQWYEAHYALPIGRKKGKKVDQKEHVGADGKPIPDPLTKPRSNHVQRKVDARKASAKVDPHLDEQFVTGLLYAAVSSRPGQSGRCDGYILEGEELAFYLRKIRAKK